MKKTIAILSLLAIIFMSSGCEKKDVGFAPSSGYDRTITVLLAEATTATTISVSSINDDDGYALALSATNPGYFTIDPGQDDAERITCTSTSGSTLTGCTRGLPADGSITTGSSTLVYEHDVGSRIIMTNIAQFYSNYINIWDAQTKAGVLTFSDYPVLPGSSPTSNSEAASKGYADNLAIQGGATSTEGVTGFSQLATQAEMAAGTFDSNEPQILSTNYSTSTPYSGTATSVPITGYDGKLAQGFWDLTDNYAWTGSDTIASTTITNFQCIDPSALISTTTVQTGRISQNAAPYSDDHLVNKTYTDTGSYVQRFFDSGTHAVSTGDTTFTFAHGFGVVPDYIRFTMHGDIDADLYCLGIYDGSTYESIGANSAVVGQSTTQLCGNALDDNDVTVAWHTSTSTGVLIDDANDAGGFPKDAAYVVEIYKN